MKKSFILAALLLSGCADVPKLEMVRLPDGDPGVIIHCDGSLEMSSCLKTAGSACPAGYAVLDQRSESHPYSLEGVGSGVQITRTMVVKCKPQPPARVNASPSS